MITWDIDTVPAASFLSHGLGNTVSQWRHCSALQPSSDTFHCRRDKELLSKCTKPTLCEECQYHKHHQDEEKHHHLLKYAVTSQYMTKHLCNVTPSTLRVKDALNLK